MSFWIYIAGYMILIAGLATGAHLLNVPLQWIGVIVLCLVGVAIARSLRVRSSFIAEPKRSLRVRSSFIAFVAEGVGTASLGLNFELRI